MTRWLQFIIVCGMGTAIQAAPPLIELTSKDGEVWRGKSVVHNSRTCWLEQQDGRLREIDLEQVTSFRQIAPAFAPVSGVEVRAELTREFGKGLEVQARGMYVIVAAPGSGRRYAEILDGVQRSYWQHYSRRNFNLFKPTYPLVAIIFPSRADFAAYAAKDHVTVGSTLQGYYNPQSNRIAFYDAAPTGKNVRTSFFAPPSPLIPSLGRDLIAANERQMFGLNSFGSDSGGTGNTLVHEAIHQLAFNTGLHSRLAENPRWLVEGVAMMFEAQLSDDAPEGPRGGNIHLDRLQWFRNGLKNRPARLQQLITDEESLFRADALYTYAEAWCLTYFLSETRSSNFSRYLRLIAERDLLRKYSAATRLEDFQSCFGKDVSRLEVDLLRFIDGL